MKTWLQFLTNLSNKILLAGALGLSLASSSLPLQAQSGFYSNFERLIEIQESNYTKKMEKLAGEPSELNDLLDPDKADLDPDFISSMIFHTPSRYASLGGADRCGLYDLILSNLARGPEGELQNFIVRYQTKEGVLKTVATDRKRFFQKVAFKQCPNVEKFQQYFNIKNLPNTLKTINLEAPTSEKACAEVHKRFTLDPKTPYLCYLSEQIKSIPTLEAKTRSTPRSQYRKLQRVKRELKIAKVYEELLNPNSVDYLDSLCRNIESSKAFCDGFFNASFWRRVVNKEKPRQFLENSCQELIGKTELTDKNYSDCARKIEREPALCRFLGSDEGILTPKPDCESLSSTLNLSRLKADYNDCPGKTANAGVVNISRIINHFSKQDPPESEFCHASTTAVFANFTQEMTDGRFWNVSLCYEDKITNKEVCLPTVNGDLKESELSLPTVVEKILRKTTSFGADQKCGLVSAPNYRPELLDFKSGCFIIIDKDECFGTSCEYRILVDQREVDHIKPKSGTQFDYFPKDFANENFAQIKLLEQKFKLRSARVINVSSLKRALDENKNGLVHGVACAEDLFPEHFSKRSFNQCAPLPFIIDGYKTKRGLYSVSLRSAYDSIHAPRLVPWSHLFSALKDYQRLHPLNTWGLNVIY